MANTGTCGFCDKENVELVMRHNRLICAECAALSDNTDKTAAKVNSVVQAAHIEDEKIKLKQDIFNAATVSFIELRSAIQNDETIPPAQKGYKLAEEIEQRILKLQPILFEQREAVQQTENTLYQYVKNLQSVTATLTKEQQEKFKKYDINYNPQSPKFKEAKEKKAKKAKAAKRPTNFNRRELPTVCAKYKVPADMVAMIGVQHNITAEEAAKRAAAALYGQH